MVDPSTCRKRVIRALQFMPTLSKKSIVATEVPPVAASCLQLPAQHFLLPALQITGLIMKTSITVLISMAASLSGCAIDPIARGGILSTNAAKAYIYTPEEQANMTESGTIPTMLTPSEVKELFSRKQKVEKPTGEVNYCDAGLSSLIQARRNEALASIDEACGGKDQYSIRHEGLGNIKARYVGNVQLTPGCARSKVIIFRCNGAQPTPDMRK
jgi:hypothetical protein